MSSFLKHLLILAAVLTVGVSQVFGISRGWQCVCSGEPVPSAAPQCEAAACGCAEGHTMTETAGDCGDSSSGQDRNSPHQHVAVADAVESVPFTPLAVKLPDFTPWEPPFLFLVAMFEKPYAAEVEEELTRPPTDRERELTGATDAVRAAKCAVLVV